MIQTISWRRAALLIAVALSLLTGGYAVAQNDDTAATLREYAQATWHSLEAMIPPDGVLIADNMNADGALGLYTSPTNIGLQMTGIVAARELGFISSDAARNRLADILAALAQLERHAESGQFYNWYDPATGDLLRRWPSSNDTVCPFLSSVDNGWLAAALMTVRAAVPELAQDANRLLEPMDFGFYYDPQAGLLRGGYWPPDMQPDNSSCARGFTGHHYGTLNSEPRIASYIGIALGQVPATHYFRMARTFPDDCAWGWQEMRPVGREVRYLAPAAGSDDGNPTPVIVFEGVYTYQDMLIVPSWGGSMFEALMPTLFVPEAAWGPRSWAINHPRYVQAQIAHGLVEAQYGYWGFSPASNPADGYREFGVDALGMSTDGYASDLASTLVDYGFAGCGRNEVSIPDAADYVSGVVTPHASFLALEFAPDAALDNLARLRADFDLYDEQYGFYDSVRVDTGGAARRFLALDQGMTLLAIANHLTGGTPRSYFASQIEPAVRPLLAQETFGSFVD
jgi:hypothetical protein